jgi:hypothetical protein
MKRRWNSNTVVLTVLGVVLFLSGIDYGRKFYLESTKSTPVEVDASAPSFKEGEEAPEFELADKAGVKHTLTSLVNHKDTLLWFLCGCNSCRGMQTYMGQLAKKMGPKAPQVVSVSTQSPDFETRYREMTGLPQTLLYEQQGGEVMEKYRGHPCPRIYRLKPDRKVAWIGPSTTKLRKVSDMGMHLAHELGFAIELEKDSTKPKAPSMQALRKIDPPGLLPGGLGGPGGPGGPGAQLPAGTVMGPNGPMPAHVPVAPGQSNPPGIGGAPGNLKDGLPEAYGVKKTPAADDHAGHDHAGHSH